MGSAVVGCSKYSAARRPEGSSDRMSLGASAAGRLRLQLSGTGLTGTTGRECLCCLCRWSGTRSQALSSTVRLAISSVRRMYPQRR